MEDKRAVSREEGENLGIIIIKLSPPTAKSLKLNFIEVSAKDSFNIEQSF